jgi:hypothetical protein
MLDMADPATRILAERHSIRDDRVPGLLRWIWEAFTKTADSIDDQSVCKICADGDDIRCEALETFHDSLSPIYDQMDRKWFWKGESIRFLAAPRTSINFLTVMEYLPIQTKRQTIKDDNKALYWTSVFSPSHRWYLLSLGPRRINRGLGRKIFKHIMQRRLLLHPSVRYRLTAVDEHGQPGTYSPRARPNLNYHKPIVDTVKSSSSNGWLTRIFKGIRKRFRMDKARPLTNQRWIDGFQGLQPWFQWETYGHESAVSLSTSSNLPGSGFAEPDSLASSTGENATSPAFPQCTITR